MRTIKIQDREIGEGQPCYIIAEVSCNHEGNFDEAKRIIEAAAEAGADAAKIQTYKPDTMTRDFDTKPEGTMWEDIDLFKLYEKAQTPWDWHEKLKAVADACGIHFFSSPFDETAVDYLVEMEVPVLKIASFEAVDIKLLEKCAKTGLPIILSNGMTNFLEMDEAIRTLRDHGTKDLAVLHCNSGYPASFDEVNLKTMQAISEIYDVVTGLSDHTIFADDKNYAAPMAHVTPLEAVKAGAKVIELHLMMDREAGRLLNEKNEGGFDWPFSREPAELKKLIDMIRSYEADEDVEYESDAEKVAALRTHGQVNFEPTEKEMNSRILRPTLWVVEDVKQGEPLKFMGGHPGNVDSIRPTGGLHIRYADLIDGKKAARDLKAGQPLSWDMVELK